MTDETAIIKKRALITGIAGQDGSYLAELLLRKGYEVYGIIRKNEQPINIAHIKKQIHFISCVLTDPKSVQRMLGKLRLDEIYNLAGQTSVAESWKLPRDTVELNGLTVLSFMSVIKEFSPQTKFFQASTAEMYGNVAFPQNEDTPFSPKNPYGVSKLFAFWITRNYREAHGVFVANGILFNHESERRKVTFVTRKITDGLARIKLGLEKELTLGSLDAKRDWGYAPEYVEAMWLMLQQEQPEDYVIATGETHTVREFVEAAGKALGMDITWKGKGVEEVGADNVTGKIVVRIDPEYFRPAEVDLLLGDPSKAKAKLGWTPKVGFEELVKKMALHDLGLLSGK